VTWVRFLEGQSYGNVLRSNGPSVSQERERYSDESRVAEGSGAAPKPTHVLIVRSETAKGCHEVFNLAGRRGFAGFEVMLNA
jgi:hypothetical protein